MKHTHSVSPLFWRATLALLLVSGVPIGSLAAPPPPAQQQPPAQQPPAQQPPPAQQQPSPPPAAQPGAVAPGRAEQPAILPLGNDRFRIGALIVDRRMREVRMPAAIAVREGPLEYLACAPGGKLYESLLRIEVDPYHFHLALLLIGLEPSNNLRHQGDAASPSGDQVTIEVTWRAGESTIVRRAENLMWEQRDKRPMAHTTWAFTGSTFAGGVFAASVHKSLVAVYNDPQAILNNPLPSRADDSSYSTRTDALPPVDTPLEVVLRAAAPERRAFPGGRAVPGG